MTSKSTSGQDDDYMEEEGEGEESVRAGIRMLDEDSDEEEGDETIEGDKTGGGTQRTRDSMLKEVTAVSTECVHKDLNEKVKKVGCGSVQSGKNVICKTTKTSPPPAIPASSLDLHGSNVKRFSQQYYQIRADRMRTDNKVTLGGVGTDARVGVARWPDSGFNIQNDHRQMSAKNFHRVDVGRNISTSLSVDLGCLACAVPHSIKEGMGAGRAQVVVISDQSFPPILPTNDGQCVVVVRVEDAALSELVSVFTDFFANFVNPVGAFPPGSLILVGSLSHLGRRGICNYAEELVRVIGSLGAKVGVGVEIIPRVFVLLGGIGDPGRL